MRPVGEAEDRIGPFVEPLKALAEGRFEPADWLEWWNRHGAEIEGAFPRGWFLKLKPLLGGGGAHRATLHSQRGARYVLEALNVSFGRSDRYERAWQDDLARFSTAEQERRLVRGEQIQPQLATLTPSFPKFAAFLKKRAADVIRIDEPATEAEIAATESALGVHLPEAFKRWLRCTRELQLDGFSIGLDEVVLHPATIPRVQRPAALGLCIAEYWLEADGDQVLVERTSEARDDGPVFYVSVRSAA